jgi:hypothetical protein
MFIGGWIDKPEVEQALSWHAARHPKSHASHAGPGKTAARAITHPASGFSL